MLGLAFAPLARAGLLGGDGIGVYGDSMSMQYSFWLPLAPLFGTSEFYNGTQLNWVDQLVQNGYNFGPQQTVNDVPYNSFDQAVAGQTSANLAAQVSNLSSSVILGNVKLVVLNMGANDFNNGEYGTIYHNAANHSYNPLADSAVQSFMNTVVGNITSAVNATLAENASVHMILTTIPDVGVTPLDKANYPVASQRAEVTQVIQAVNNRIINLAAQHHMPVLDLQKLANVTLTPPTVAGITMIDAGGKTGNYEFLNDNFHPGTVLQGIMANAYLAADQIAYGDTIAPVSDQVILASAGLTPTGPTPTYFNVAPYIIFAPEPSTFVLAGFAAIAIAIVIRQRRR